MEDGFRNIIIVHLGKNENAFHKAVVNLDISNVKFYHVWPSEKLGGMLKAGAALTKDRIEQGYNDADKQLQEIIGIGRE